MQRRVTGRHNMSAWAPHLPRVLIHHIHESPPWSVCLSSLLILQPGNSAYDSVNQVFVGWQLADC